MAELPPVVQDFIADTTEYVAGMMKAKIAADDFAGAVANARFAIQASEDAIQKMARAATRADPKFITNKEFIRGVQQYTDVINHAIMDQALLAVTADESFGALVKAVGQIKTPVGGVMAGFLANLGLTRTGLHWIVAGALEIAAVAIPALIAFGAALAALTPSFVDIVQHSRAAITAYGDLTNASGRASNATTRLLQQFDKLAASLKPQALSLYGSSILIAAGHFGVFAQIAKTASDALATFGAKLVIAMQSGLGNQLTGLVHAATQDMIAFGQVLGNIGHIIVNLASAAPGVAEMVLGIVAAGTKLLEWLTHFQGAMQALLLISAFTRWGGDVVIPMLVSMIMWVGKLVAVFGILAKTIGMIRTAGALQGIANALVNVGKISPNVILAVGAIALAVGFLAYKAATAKDSVEKLTHSLNVRAATAGTLNAVNVLGANMDKLSSQTASVTDNFNKAAMSMQHFPGATINFDLGKIHQSMQIQLQDFRNLITNGELVAQVFHVNLAQAFSLASMAGVKLQDTLAGDRNATRTMLQEIRSFVVGIENTTVPVGRLGADINALQFQTEQAASQVPKLNQAWDNFINTITGGEQAMTQFATAAADMRKGFLATGASMTGVFRGIAFNASTAKVGLGGLSQASLQATQQFLTMISGPGQQLIDWLRQTQSFSAITSSQFTTAVRAMVSAQLGFTSNWKPGLAILRAVANEAGFRGVATFKALAEWVSKGGHSMQDLNRIIAQATIGMSNLNNVAAALNNTFQAQLIQGMTTARFKVGGFQQMMNSLAFDMMHNMPAASVQMANAIYHSMIKAGVGIQFANNWLKALHQQINNLPASKTFTLYTQAVPIGGGRYLTGGPGGAASTPIPIPGKASGGAVTGGAVAGGALVINVHGSVHSEQSLANAVQTALLNKAFVGPSTGIFWPGRRR